MTTEELNTHLYEKMFAEQEKYRQWLLIQPPNETLKHAYEYTIREDILLSLEYNELHGTGLSARCYHVLAMHSSQERGCACVILKEHHKIDG